MSAPINHCYIPSREMNRRLWVQRQNTRNRTGKPLHSVPDNSEPWGPPPRSIAEALEISDRVARLAADVRKQLPTAA